MAIPLERPELPRVEPLRWPMPVVSVFGPGAEAFVAAMAEARPDARVMRVELRHAEGWELRDAGLVAHPDALLEALEASRADAPLVLGLGAAFAVAVEPTLGVWITGGTHAIALPPALRAAARRAHLVLEEARLPLAADLVDAL